MTTAPRQPRASPVARCSAGPCGSAIGARPTTGLQRARSHRRALTRSATLQNTGWNFFLPGTAPRSGRRATRDIQKCAPVRTAIADVGTVLGVQAILQARGDTAQAGLSRCLTLPSPGCSTAPGIQEELRRAWPRAGDSMRIVTSSTSTRWWGGGPPGAAGVVCCAGPEPVLFDRTASNFSAAGRVRPAVHYTTWRRTGGSSSSRSARRASPWGRRLYDVG